LTNTVKTLSDVKTIQSLATSIITALSKRSISILSVKDQQYITLYSVEGSNRYTVEVYNRQNDRKIETV
jgi:hypothetical protein